MVVRPSIQWIQPIILKLNYLKRKEQKRRGNC